LSKAHAGGAQVAGSVPTPGAPNHYYTKKGTDHNNDDGCII
jgi:hypothetical protein